METCSTFFTCFERHQCKTPAASAVDVPSGRRKVLQFYNSLGTHLLSTALYTHWATCGEPQNHQPRKHTPYSERLEETRNCQSTKEGASGFIGGRWRISKVFSQQVTLNQDFDVGRRKEHAQDGKANSWSSGKARMGRRDFRNCGRWLEPSRERVQSVPLGVTCTLGRAEGPMRGWHLRGREYMEVRNRKSRRSLCLGVGEKNRSPTGGRKTRVSRE